MLDGLNRFVKAVSGANYNRSTFDRSHSYKTTFKAGDLVPVYLDEVLPGDTFKIDHRFVLRNLTPLVPVMDNAFIDFFFFYVPSRIIAPFNGDNYKAIFGENVDTYWAPSKEPTVTLYDFASNDTDVANHSVANYFGLPIGLGVYEANHHVKINPYPFIAYALIWDNYFRDQNTQAPILAQYNASNIGSLVNSFCLSDSCLPGNKFHDYFTSCLPAPQKGPSVTLPLGDLAPLTTGEVYSGLSGMTWYTGGAVTPTSVKLSGNSNSAILTGEQNTTPGSNSGTGIYPNNLYADLQAATSAPINMLRQAFAVQRLYERDARGGSRYNELIYSHFGTVVPDNTIQVPEFLGGNRTPINITQVTQTSSTTDTSALGFTGAFSNTYNSEKDFVKSFTEPGFIIGLAVVRTYQTYSQGIDKIWSRHRRFDYYWDVFAHLGEQPVYADELFVKCGTGTSDYDPTSTSRQVFGYQEYAASYRTKLSLVTGSLSPNSDDNSFVPWTYTNDFSAVPVLNDDFMKQNSSVVGKTLVDTTTSDQYLIDIFFELKTTRVMPTYSIPGMIDHF